MPQELTLDQELMLDQQAGRGVHVAQHQSRGNGNDGHGDGDDLRPGSSPISTINNPDTQDAAEPKKTDVEPHKQVKRHEIISGADTNPVEFTPELGRGLADILEKRLDAVIKLQRLNPEYKPDTIERFVLNITPDKLNYHALTDVDSGKVQAALVLCLLSPDS